MHAATHLTPVSNTRLWAGRIMHAHLPEGEKMDVVRSTCNFSHRVNAYDGWRTRFTISPTMDRLTRPPSA